MSQNFTLADIARVSEAFVLFSLVLVFPGYVIGWFADVLQFRRRLPLTRFVVAVPLSIGICPIVSFYLWRWSIAAVWVFYGGCCLAFAALFFRETTTWLREWRAIGKRELTCFGIVAVWLVGAMLILVDLQIDHRLYFSTVTYDYALRAAFVSAISRTGIPPHNPFFYPGRPFNLKYHYFWLILCSLVQKLSGGGIAPRQAFIAGTICCGTGLFATIALYLRFFSPKAKIDITRRVLLGIGLLCVTGLDIIPVALSERAAHTFQPTIEWWNSDQVTAWIDALLWVPHHMAALISCLTGFLLLWRADWFEKRGQKAAIAVLAGLLFANAVGLSIYVTLVFAVFLSVWTIVLLVGKQRQQFWLIFTSGVTAVLLAAPFLSGLFAKEGSTATHGAAATAATGFPLQFSVRHFSIVDLMFGLGDFGWKSNVVHLLVLPLNYLFELGFFLLVGVIQGRRLWRSRRQLSLGQLCAVTMLATSMGFCTFVRSSLIAANDLGSRGFLLAQFVLLLWAADLVDDGILVQGERSSFAFLWDKRAALGATLLLGVAGTVYDVVKLRIFPIVSDTTSTPLSSWLSPDRNLGARTYAMRGLYEELKRSTPVSAVFQHNPKALPQDNFASLYADRQFAAETPSCSVHFGGDERLCQERMGEIQALFDNAKAFRASQVGRVCRELGIDVLVVQDTDKVWQDRGSWVWARRPIFANGYARAFGYVPIAKGLRAIEGDKP